MQSGTRYRAIYAGYEISHGSFRVARIVPLLPCILESGLFVPPSQAGRWEISILSQESIYFLDKGQTFGRRMV